jgi:asparagine synthase (glutamine-hydrolysing)
MCGIAGIFSPDAAALGAIASMTAAVRHRGPDDEGYVFIDSASGRAWPRRGADSVPAFAHQDVVGRPPDGADLALGHRRLAILDLGPGGHGPMASRDERLWVSYNGEIYNYLELRAELEKRGHRFSTGCDTEVLLAAWLEWEEAALDRCNGMFAFALFDARRRRLYCARDRFGVKPLHYSWDGEQLAFASEIKAVVTHPRVPRRPDERRLLGFLARGALDEDGHTFFEGVRSLPASHLLTLELATRRLQVRPWYRLPPGGGGGDPGAIGALLEDAVRLRLRSDVDVGTCLSGGLDSSSIVALTARLRGRSDRGRRSFSIVYAEPGLDEGRFVDEVVRATGVDSARTTATAADLLRDLPALVRAQDEPIPSPGPYSHWRVMALASEAGVKVLLDGQGADETLAGYHYQFGPYLAEISRRRGLAAALRAAAALRRVTGVSPGLLAGLLAYHRLPMPKSWRNRIVGRFATHGYVPRSALSRAYLDEHGPLPGGRHQPRATLSEELRAELTSTSLPALLRYEDRNSMAFGIEARTPFLDFRLVEAALALPAEALIRDGWTKAPLREAMRGVLPEAVRMRRDKLGFPTPERRWLVELAGPVREWLGPGSLLATRLRPGLLDRWRNRSDEELGRQRGLWRLVAAEHWLRHAASVGTP